MELDIMIFHKVEIKLDGHHTHRHTQTDAHTILGHTQTQKIK